MNQVQEEEMSVILYASDNEELVDHCDCYQYGYSDLEDAIAIFDELADSK